MGEYDEIYRLRTTVDLTRQPRHAPAYNLLGQLFVSQHCTQPYFNDHLDDTGWGAILKDPAYQSCGKGLRASVGDQLLYRVMSFRNLLRHSAPRLLGAIGSHERDWVTFTSKQRTIQNWMPLQAFVSGLLTGRRKCTWWTTSDPSQDTFHTCHFIGLPDDWLANRTVVLRCRASAMSPASLSVPSTLDGFDSPIFCATRDDDGPSIGRCIDLRQQPLALGGEELTCPSVPVSAISCVALSLNLPPPPSAQAELSALLPALVAFYESM